MPIPRISCREPAECQRPFSSEEVCAKAPVGVNCSSTVRFANTDVRECNHPPLYTNNDASDVCPEGTYPLSERYEQEYECVSIAHRIYQEDCDATHRRFMFTCVDANEQQVFDKVPLGGEFYRYKCRKTECCTFTNQTVTTDWTITYPACPEENVRLVSCLNTGETIVQKGTVDAFERLLHSNHNSFRYTHTNKAPTFPRQSAESFQRKCREIDSWCNKLKSNRTVATPVYLPTSLHVTPSSMAQIGSGTTTSPIVIGLAVGASLASGIAVVMIFVLIAYCLHLARKKRN